jgi:hypothetical protein
VARGGPVWRPHHRLRDRLAGEEANEFGLIAHGPDSSKLIRLVNDLLHRWSHKRSNNPSTPLTRTPPSATGSPPVAASGGRIVAALRFIKALLLHTERAACPRR